MKRLTSIVAMTHEGVIGVQNGLPWRLKSDLAFFRQQTTGSAVVMGRKTFDSLDRRPLQDRINIVLSHNRDLVFSSSDLLIAYSIPEALTRIAKLPRSVEEVFVIGGATMYEQFSRFVDRYLVTIVDKFVDGDTKINLSLFSNEEDWNSSLLFQKPENKPSDEASFSTFELTRRDKRLSATLRRETVTGYQKRYRRSATARPKLHTGGQVMGNLL